MADGDKARRHVKSNAGEKHDELIRRIDLLEKRLINSDRRGREENKRSHSGQIRSASRSRSRNRPLQVEILPHAGSSCYVVNVGADARQIILCIINAPVAPIQDEPNLPACIKFGPRHIRQPPEMTIRETLLGFLSMFVIAYVYFVILH